MSVQTINVSIRLSIGMFVRSPRYGSDYNLFRNLAGLVCRKPNEQAYNTQAYNLISMDGIQLDQVHKVFWVSVNFPVNGLTITTRNLLSGYHAEPQQLTIGIKGIPTV